MKIDTIRVEMLPDGRMTPANAAKYLGYKKHTLDQMRVAGNGPKYVKTGRIFYFKDDLDAWVRRNDEKKNLS